MFTTNLGASKFDPIEAAQEKEKDMNDKNILLNELYKTGVVAVIRAEQSDTLIQTAEALIAGGVNFIEFTMTIPNAMEIIRESTQRLKDACFIGAGTVIDSETARIAILAGAQYIVSPCYDEGLVRLCNSYSVPVMPGAYTPTEVLNAWKNGADIVKIFPADLGGPALFKDLKGPFPQIKIMPTGGVNFDTAAAFIKAGAYAIGVGGALADKKLIASGNFKQITENARRFVEIVEQARS